MTTAATMQVTGGMLRRCFGGLGALGAMARPAVMGGAAIPVRPQVRAASGTPVCRAQLSSPGEDGKTWLPTCHLRRGLTRRFSLSCPMRSPGNPSLPSQAPPCRALSRPGTFHLEPWGPMGTPQRLFPLHFRLGKSVEPHLPVFPSPALFRHPLAAPGAQFIVPPPLAPLPV